MRFLVDECTGPAVAQWLKENGHDVFSVFDERPGIPDEEVLRLAFSERRILITNDKDFGEKVFWQRQAHHGVILLRLKDERSKNKTDVLRKLLAQYKEVLAERFFVATEYQVRFRKT
jgi:predicted nuclease of predicted toxin-antitoxin system